MPHLLNIVSGNSTLDRIFSWLLGEIIHSLTIIIFLMNSSHNFSPIIQVPGYTVYRSCLPKSFLGIICSTYSKFTLAIIYALKLLILHSLSYHLQPVSHPNKKKGILARSFSLTQHKLSNLIYFFRLTLLYHSAFLLLHLGPCHGLHRPPQ